VASRALAEHFDIYPKGDVRHETTLDEDIADLKAASLDQVKAFHRDFYGTVPAEMAIVGDFDAEAIAAGRPAVRRLEGPDGTWRRCCASTCEIKRPYTKVLNTPEKENGFYTARMNLDLNVDDPDYPALMLADYIFGGGGLRSRLMDRIRQKEGLSYGGGSQLNGGRTRPRRHAFSISAIAAPQNLARVDVAVREEAGARVKDGFTAAELAGAKSGLMQQRVQNRADDGALAAGWTSYMYRGRTYEWSADFEKRLMAVTLPQLNAAFRKADRSGQAVGGDGRATRQGQRPGEGGKCTLNATLCHHKHCWILDYACHDAMMLPPSSVS
jgi:zinc protease